MPAIKHSGKHTRPPPATCAHTEAAAQRLVESSNPETSSTPVVAHQGQDMASTTLGMPGSFAPVPITVTEDPSMVHRVMSPDRRSPNLFAVSTTPQETPPTQITTIMAMPRLNEQWETVGVQLARNLQTPRVTVPVQFGTAGQTASNFGPSVSQGNMWLNNQSLREVGDITASQHNCIDRLSPINMVSPNNPFHDLDTTTREPLEAINEEDELSYVSQTSGQQSQVLEHQSHASNASLISSGTAISARRPQLQAPLTRTTSASQGQAVYGAAVEELGPIQ
ncbi:hypothetical protein BJ165DRAFT_1572828 [Panaeolus papilionaceus]|nr:hypothetical protein BJ165DRAFT_1572828 [Panaeolus papilionaceus]